MKLDSEALTELRKGLAISDDHLDHLHKFFGDLTESLESLGSEYYLAWRVAQQEFYAIDSIFKYRNRWREGQKKMYVEE